MAIFIMDWKPGPERLDDRQYTFGMETAADVADLEAYGKSVNAALGSTAMRLDNGDIYILSPTEWVKL
jgi:hypothetical protein